MRLRRIEPILRRALRGPCRVAPGSRILVAVSGGADSTALLLGLKRLSTELEISVAAAHLHHGLRGAEADQDLAFVRAMCDSAGVPLKAARWNTRARMIRRGLSGQAGLRTLRREFLTRAARTAGATAIATAHTGDDQLETLILRLMRGTGLPGLAGMAHRRGRWIKPLLEATRREIETDLRRACRPWREDRSNRDLAYARNRVRHAVIPAWTAAMGGPSDRAHEALVQAALFAAREAREARRLVRESACKAALGNEPNAISLMTLRNAEPAVRRELLRRLWRSFGRTVGLTRRHLAALDDLVTSPRACPSIQLPDGCRAVRDRLVLRLVPSSSDPGVPALVWTAKPR